MEKKIDGGNAPMIYGLIGQAMQKIGAIGKNSKNEQQKFMYRGIDAVMNALSPVMSELGLFIVPEVLEQTREERTSIKKDNYGNERTSTLLYSILKIKYTMFAPDGSNVSCVVIGEGMDSGDKASNKAMSVGFKYAAFQMFCIPTEEMIDPDAEVHEVAPKTARNAPKQAQQTPARENAPAQVTTAAKVPQNPPADPVPPVLEYLAKEREGLRVVREITKAENNAIWKAQVAALTDAKLIPAKPLADFTQKEAEALIDAMYKNFTPKGTVLKNDGKPA
jgi:hypothetical protein